MKIHLGDYFYPMVCVCVCVYSEFLIILKCKKRLLFIFTNNNLFIISMTNADISSNGMVANALENIN